MHKTVVINVVGLTRISIARAAPRLAEWAAAAGSCRSAPRFRPSPARRSPTTSPAATPSARHRRQRLVLRETSAKCDSGGSPTSWCRRRRSGIPRAREDPAFTCANLFWWFNMYSSADYQRDAAADVPGRRAQAARRLHHRRQRCATSCSAARARFRSSTSGDRRASIESTPLDRGGREAGGAEATPDADARLPAASRLQPAAGRAHVGRSRCGRSRRSTGSAAI